MSDHVEPSEAAPSPPPGPAASHPIRLVVTDDLRRSRLTVFFRLLLVIPLAVWAALWAFVAFFALVAAWFAALFTGRVPGGLHRFLAALVRFSTHLSAYLWIAANPYPSFTGTPGYPVDVVIDDAAKQSRLTIFFRIVLAIPALIVVNALQNLAWILALFAWFIALFTGRMNEGLRDLLGYCLRYQAQTYGYVLLLTQRYPSFSTK